MIKHNEKETKPTKKSISIPEKPKGPDLIKVQESRNPLKDQKKKP